MFEEQGLAMDVNANENEGQKRRFEEAKQQ
jgi:hypothetical protein